jgi:hypothetical protein
MEYEYRVLIERPFIHSPHPFYRTDIEELARLELKNNRKRYETWEPNTRIYMERRQVTDWEEID